MGINASSLSAPKFLHKAFCYFQPKNKTTTKKMFKIYACAILALSLISLFPRIKFKCKPATNEGLLSLTRGQSERLGGRAAA